MMDEPIQNDGTDKEGEDGGSLVCGWFGGTVGPHTTRQRLTAVKLGGRE